MYQFVFTQVREWVSIAQMYQGGIQLSDIAFFEDADKNVPITIVNASNPGGDTANPNQAAWPNIADGNVTTKWYDGNMRLGIEGMPNPTSTLVLHLAEPKPVVSYQLFSGNDVVRRDPVAWSFGILREDGSYEVLSTVDETSNPEAMLSEERFTGGATTSAIMPPPSPATGPWYSCGAFFPRCSSMIGPWKIAPVTSFSRPVDASRILPSDPCASSSS